MTPSWLAPAGPGASAIATLTWTLLITGAVIYLVVLGLLGLAILRGTQRARRHGGAGALPEPTVTTAGDGPLARWFLGGTAVATTVIVTVILVLTVRTLASLLPDTGPAPVTVEVVGHQWWWSVRYLDATRGATVDTANEVRVPVGQRVALRLRASDVIHSFWVPQLQGKLDMIPGQVNVTWLQADRPGVYRGMCAEYCGLQHARMAFLVIAEPAAAFEAWLQHEGSPALAPADDLARQGERLFLDRGCAFCHAVRGTAAFFGRGGPDLTHIASRQTLGAATLTNVSGHLAGWIANPQALKPGNRMPQVALEPEEFHAVLRYLQGLR